MTGTRAEFGLLLPVMRAIETHPRLRLRTVVTGTHLTAGTWRDVKAAGFTIDAKVFMQTDGAAGRAADVAALGRGVGGFGKVFGQIKPDAVVALGDRIEVLAAASAASVGGFRVAHVHGGDRAEGIADEAIRHAVTKLAHLHLAATAQSRMRLIRMGEAPAAVFNVGSPAVDGLNAVDPADDAPEVVMIQHPIGAPAGQEKRWALATLSATRRFNRLVMAPNHDPGREGIGAALAATKTKAISHLPRARFVSLLRGAKLIVGNSSAGLIEAAALKVPAVNVGPRQAGRQKPANVVDCNYGRVNVARGLCRALRLDLRRLHHPYGNGQAGKKIADLLARIDLATVGIRKRNTY